MLAVLFAVGLMQPLVNLSAHRCIPQVPVGGAVVAAPDPRIVTAVSKLYPGRASVAPVLDLFITLLSLVRYVDVAVRFGLVGCIRFMYAHIVRALLRALRGTWLPSVRMLGTQK